LRKRTGTDKKAVGEDIKAVELLWPVGYPHVTKLGKDLWEVRTSLQDRICRIFFTVTGDYMVLLHGIIKKSQKTPKGDVDVAKKRRDMVLSGGVVE
jgi:phage-related protein